MAIILCMNCGKPRPVAPWKSTRVVKVASCAKCKPQPLRDYAKPHAKVVGFVSTLVVRVRQHRKRG